MQTKQNTAIQSTVKIAGITFTANAMRSSEVARQIPVGYRIAHLHEVAWEWHTNEDFRNILVCRNTLIDHPVLLSGVWTSQVGLKSKGYHRIADVVEDRVSKVFEAVSKDKFFGLKSKDRSWHFPGKSRVAVYRGTFIHEFGLYVDANRGSEIIARAALVKLSNEELLQQARVQNQAIIELADQFRDIAAKLGSIINQSEAQIRIKHVLRK